LSFELTGAKKDHPIPFNGRRGSTRDSQDTIMSVCETRR